MTKSGDFVPYKITHQFVTTYETKCRAKITRQKTKL